jgi:hypothetical protein
LAWWKKEFAKYVDVVLGELREKRQIDENGSVSLTLNTGAIFEIDPWLCSALDDLSP